MVEIVPLWLVNVVSFTTVFSVMAAIGTSIRPGACVPYLRAPGLLLTGVMAAVVIVPAIGLLISLALGIPLAERVGVALTVIAPGAPLALRRALGSGAHSAFAPLLQIAIALLAVPAVPVWVMICNAVFGTRGVVDAAAVARQVFLAQLLPLALGALTKQALPIWADRIGTALARAGAILLIAAILAQIVDLHRVILATPLRPIVVAVMTTVLAIGLGHAIGRRASSVGHAVAVGSALRNVGMALMIAIANRTPPAVEAAIVAYALTAIVMVSVYIALWNRATAGARARPPPVPQQTAADLVPSCYPGKTGSRLVKLAHNAQPALDRPAAPPANSGDDLHRRHARPCPLRRSYKRR